MKHGTTFLASFILLVTSYTAHAQIKIVTTTGMIADLVHNIGGNHVDVTPLMNSGIDPHLYKATQGDLRKIKNADIVIYNGLYLEGKMQDIFDKLAKKKPVYAVTENLAKNQLIEDSEHADPHIWFDVSLWQLAANRVLEILIKHDSSNAKSYEANAQNYIGLLKAKHQWVQAQIKLIPKNQRVLITAHDAFGYLGKAYGIEVMGLQGISTAAEFGLQDIKRLKDIIVEREIKAVFIESSVSPRFIESLVAGVKAQGHELKIGGELFSDAMGAKGSGADNYLGMVEHNINTIVGSLK